MTIPFEDFEIQVVSVDFDHNKKTNPRHDEDLKDYMISQGYRLEMIHFTGDIYENHVPQHLLPF